MRNTPISKGSVPKRDWRPFIAAVFLLGLGLVSWWFWPPPQNAPQQIFANHYEPYELMFDMGTEAADKRMEVASKFYRQRQFTEAIPVFEILTSEEGEHAQELLALAISRFEIGKKEKAFLPLQQIIKDKDPFLSDLAYWYSALFYLKLEQSAKAIPFLEKLTNSPNADKQETAQKILEQLKIF